MEEQNTWLLVRHVGMDRDDVDAAYPNRSKGGLQLVLGHGEISVNNGIIIAAGKRRPCVDAHSVVDFYTMHRRRMTDGNLSIPLFASPVIPKILSSGSARLNSSPAMQFRRTNLSVGRCSPNFLNLVVDFSDSRSEFFSRALTFNVHKINFRMIE